MAELPIVFFARPPPCDILASGQASCPRCGRAVALAVAAQPLVLSRRDSPSDCPKGHIILLHIIARGKIARSPEAELVARYEKRITWPIKLTELPETGGRIPDPLTPFKTVLLDERGKNLSSQELADILGRWRDDGLREARFLLGAADGHSKQERADADLLLAFGKATWPHLMARAMLAEQLYRATTILAGHPYHRAG